jgi:hypothetical protein
MAKTLPFFTGYLTSLVLSTIFVWFVYRTFDFGSWTAYETAWITSGIVLVARGLAIGELCFCVLRVHPGIWALAKIILLAVSFLFLLHAGFESLSRPYWLGTFVLSLDRDLELSATAALIVLLMIGRYYQLELNRLGRRIAAGLCITSVSVLTSDAEMAWAFASHPPSWPGYVACMGRTQVWWYAFRSLPADCALIMWIDVLREPGSTTRSSPALLPASAYRELSPAVNARLRALDARLLELFGP